MMSRWGVLMLLAILLLPMSAYLPFVFAESGAEPQSTNPRSDFWRKVRQSEQGYSAVSGNETNMLIQGEGQNWRQLRNGPVVKYGSWMLLGMPLLLLLFYRFKGKQKLRRPRTGKTVQRWSASDRFLHWYTTCLFIILAVTGLSLLYGRAVLIPLFGHPGFAAYAGIAKLSHNLLGPFFMLGLVLMIIRWFKINFFNRVDWQWFKAFGGLIGRRHPSAGKLNGGEKIWFWCLTVAGLALCVTGLILDFPNFGQARALLQFAHLIHVVTGVILITFAFGHIYIGSVGTEGALEGMVTGNVDTAWAKQHHDLWLQELQQQDSQSAIDNKN